MYCMYVHIREGPQGPASPSLQAPRVGQLSSPIRARAWDLEGLGVGLATYVLACSTEQRVLVLGLPRLKLSIDFSC